MNKEELKDIICQSSSDYKILNEAYNYIEKLEQKNKKLKFYQQENKQLKEQLGKLSKLDETDFWLEYNRDVWKIQNENEKLKDNWNKLKEYINMTNNIDDVGMKIFDVSLLEDKMQELEKENK